MKRPDYKPTKRMLIAALNAQSPLDAKPVEVQRRKGRKLIDDELPESMREEDEKL